VTDLASISLHTNLYVCAGGMVNIAEANLGAMMGQFNGMNMSGGNMGHTATGLASIPPNTFINGPDGNLVFAAPYSGPVHHMVAADPSFSGAGYSVQYPTNSYGAYAPGTMLPYTPGRAVAFENRVPREVPGLENRRGSYSTSATESNPSTPFFGNTTDRLGATRVASLDRSAYTTPSPRDMTQYIAGNTQLKIAATDPALESLLMEDPPVPKAVPAVWTDHIKPLEQCLENRIQGNRNVYIRGLHPTTDDTLLLKYAERFGEVEQSKAIIDTATGACKGYVPPCCRFTMRHH